MRKTALLIAGLFVVVILAAGCGGGGHREIALSGTVTDVAGNPVPGAEIELDGHSVTRSVMNGTFKVSRPATGFQNIDATAVIDGANWAGSRAVDIFTDGPTMNVNVIIGPIGELGTIEGAVTDSNNNPISNARVIAIARYPQDKAAIDASIVSKVEVTDSAGEYVIPNLPSTITVGGVKQEIVYDVIASSVGLSGQARGFENQTKTATVGAGLTTRLDFALQISTDVVPTVPPEWTSSSAQNPVYAVSYTMPATITTRAAQSAYDAVKSSISERNRKIVAYKRVTTSRAAPFGSIIENDVVWRDMWLTAFDIDLPANLAGFAIYRGTTSSISPIGTYRIDFFRDPAIVTYADTSGELTPGVTYWYGVTALSTSYLDSNDQFNPDAESGMSFPASTRPIGRLQANLPQDGATVSRISPTFNWSAVSGAVNYKVFIYDAYPIVDQLFTPQGDLPRPDQLPAWGESALVTNTSVAFSDPDFTLVAGHTYWWVVMASDSTDFDLAYAYSISELRSFTAQ